MKISSIKYFALFLVLLLGSACAGKEENVEIVSSENVLPQAQKDYNYEEDTLSTEETEWNSMQSLLLKKFPGIDFPENNSLKERKMLFMPDRLGYTDKKEVYFAKDSVSFHFLEWTFEDSLKTVNAFYNWLDCFGHQCQSVRVNETINGSKEAFVIWVSNKSISYLASEKSVKRNTWQEVIFQKNEPTWNYILHQAPRGRIAWIVSVD